jgi:hypothetical protein
MGIALLLKITQLSIQCHRFTLLRHSAKATKSLKGLLVLSIGVFLVDGKEAVGAFAWLSWRKRGGFGPARAKEPPQSSGSWSLLQARPLWPGRGDFENDFGETWLLGI